MGMLSQEVWVPWALSEVGHFVLHVMWVTPVPGVRHHLCRGGTLRAHIQAH